MADADALLETRNLARLSQLHHIVVAAWVVSRFADTGIRWKMTREERDD
jgi:hypothetical protein